MLPKTLLTVIGSNQPVADLKGAIGLSADNGCHLSVAVVGIALPPPASVYWAVPVDNWAQEREEGQKEVTAQVEAVEKAIADAGISGDVTPIFCDESQIASQVGTRARYTDLALVQAVAGMEMRLFDKALEGFLFDSAKPFLVLPRAAKASITPKRILVAWNASKEAARAVHLSLDMLKSAEAVRIAMVDPVAREHAQGEEPGGDIAAYLARHGAKVTVDVLAGSGQDDAETILKHATDIAADLIVAGAYGHSRLREWFFGGTTRQLLDNPKFPLFMAH
jgi:nucleotide-binding universal stress UspA family protein